jgi:hypothetical protein
LIHQRIPQCNPSKNVSSKYLHDTHEESTMSVRTIRNLGAAVLAGGLAFAAMGAIAQSASALPDAQIESNVLKALASATDLSSQNVQSSTVYGTVTLTGNVQSEALRTEAENLTSRALGVKKVVDELTLGDTPPPPPGDQSDQEPPQTQQTPQNGQPDSSQDNQPVLQSDGTYAPAPNGSGAAPPPNGQDAQNQDAQNNQGPPPPDGRQPMDPNDGPPQGRPPVPGGQRAGLAVTVAPGALLHIRMNQELDSEHTKPGTPFDGIVLNDVVADGAVAIPRGATITGTVINVKKAGTFKGDGELSLQITSLSLGGKVYPLATDVWDHTGRDKTAGTVANTAATSAFGALLGAAVGGGRGAAIGAGAGAGIGLAGSAAGPRGQIMIPPEAELTFRVSAPATVTTVSQREMQRLSYAAGPPRPQGPPPPPRYGPYGAYYGPPPQ